MSTRRAVTVAFAALASLVVVVAPAPGQEHRTAASGNPATINSWTPPRTPDGQPDIQGFYTHVGFGTGKEQNPAELCPGPDRGGCYQSDWSNEPKGKLTASLPMDVIDPPDGKLPLQAWAAEKKEEYKRNQGDPRKLEDVDTQTRCLHSGVPRSDWAIGYVGYQIIQGPGYVTIYTEFNHEFRFIPLDGRPHLTSNIHLFGGDSVGHWEGKTLVIETVNIAVPRSTGFGMLDMQGTLVSDTLRVVERFTPVDQDTIAVEVTVDDPKVYTKPWKTAGAFVRGPKSYEVYEYACHEGNRGMQNLSFRIPKKR
jgi:hypothetical protein